MMTFPSTHTITTNAVNTALTPQHLTPQQAQQMLRLNPSAISMTPLSIPPRSTMITPQSAISDSEERMRMIGFRMRWDYGGPIPFDFMATHLGDEVVFVFVVTDSKPVVLEDSIEMFPSDTLITQLRLIEK